MAAKRPRISAALTVAAILGLVGSVATAAPSYSEWTAAENLGSTINSSWDDSGPALSKDGLSLYFTSTRPGGFGNEDIWVAHRVSTDDVWGPPANLGAAINTADNDRVPAFSRDGHWMFFGSTRPGGLGSFDQWVSWRPNVHDDFGWQAPVNLGANINTPASEPAATFFDNEDGGLPLLYFTSTRPGGMGGGDIFVSARSADGSWGPATAVVELNSPTQDARPTIRHNGLEIFFQSGRAGTVGLLDLWAATRATTSEPWSAPIHLGPLVNSVSDDFQPAISSDGETMIFGSARAGGFGLWDLYITTRAKESGKP